MNKLSTSALLLALTFSLSACLGNGTQEGNATTASSIAIMAGASEEQAQKIGNAASTATGIMQRDGGATSVAVECAKYYAAKKGCDRMEELKAAVCRNSLQIQFGDISECPKQ